jgi:hypothetical protein
LWQAKSVHAKVCGFRADLPREEPLSSRFTTSNSRSNTFHFLDAQGKITFFEETEKPTSTLTGIALWLSQASIPLIAIHRGGKT